MPVILDAGPLVAFLNRRDRHHAWAKNAFQGVPPGVRTCEAVVSEACFRLRAVEGASDAVFGVIDQGLIRVSFHLDQEALAVRKLMKKYADVPMSFADACLVRKAELDARATVLTVDSDFRLYRKLGRSVIPVLMP